MATIWFYHLLRSDLEAELPRLLEMTLKRGKRALVLASSPERVEALAQHLWVYSDESFLPHGTAKDGRPEEQPVWLAEADENANNADYLFLTDGASSVHLDLFERCHDIFDGRDPVALAAARERWKALKAAGHELAYQRQKEGGGWELVA
ncbi:MAG: DNA polymerase III subunit chi [Alphaproteobacteria bacterium]|nr:DNA polymerase III subunit chi [Alphaproteobacteria bacterium]MBU0799326.1 DNA polymerase III subunit chi [Alphaproteobacteria bacterium]MBU0888160.1 DNA polymerase III subunit chi [Alphaproteobacteria bacterium]MBU1811605.1 DNA polymerase III subunit chi [Alphaproteobacteria bacterium]MBU2091265.1 DNA polymerase III subunit chi [Alphaproteobacteria bacterium]